MRAETSLCGLAMSVTAEGESEACAQFGRALEPHRRSRRTDLPGDEELLALQLRLLPGIASGFDRLAIARAGGLFRVSGDGLTGEIDAERGRLDVLGGGPAALQIAVRLACALWLAPRGGLLLHGASVERDGRALVLLGPSGAGKTTMARRLAAAGARVVADEVAAIRLVRPAEASDPAANALHANKIALSTNDSCAGAPRVFGHPLPRRVGDGLAPEAGLPLAAIGLLAHAAPGAPATTERLSPPQAARAILRRVFLPAADGALIEGALACAESIARTVPVFSLSLPYDERATAAALALLERGN